MSTRSVARPPQRVAPQITFFDKFSPFRLRLTDRSKDDSFATFVAGTTRKAPITRGPGNPSVADLVEPRRVD